MAYYSKPVPPGPPGDLEVKDVDSDNVTLSWTKPRKTGNGKISGYIVEYKPVAGGDWAKATSVGSKDTEATGKYIHCEAFLKICLIFYPHLACSWRIEQG